MDNTYLSLPISGGQLIAKDWKDVAALFAKLAQLMAKVGPVKKDSKSQQTGRAFPYTSYEEFAAQVRIHLPACNLALHLSETKAEVVTPPDCGNDKQPKPRWRVGCSITLADTETGAFITGQSNGESFMHDDKGISKARTSALKYWLMRVLLVSERGESETDQYADTPPKSRKPYKNPVRRSEPTPPLKPINAPEDVFDGVGDEFYPGGCGFDGHKDEEAVILDAARPSPATSETEDMLVWIAKRAKELKMSKGDMLNLLKDIGVMPVEISKHKDDISKYSSETIRHFAEKLEKK